MWTWSCHWNLSLSTIASFMTLSYSIISLALPSLPGLSLVVWGRLNIWLELRVNVIVFWWLRISQIGVWLNVGREWRVWRGLGVAWSGGWCSWTGVTWWLIWGGLVVELFSLSLILWCCSFPLALTIFVTVVPLFFFLGIWGVLLISLSLIHALLTVYFVSIVINSSVIIICTWFIGYCLGSNVPWWIASYLWIVIILIWWLGNSFDFMRLITWVGFRDWIFVVNSF